ncbi:hypothetical protein [Amycolatopsis sp.]|jgi:hypothetical protein|uniref:hypothetical protein n=1 Tax=Amycolatopsis sp. TaxID=37632 RepID=UPI002E097153|nr:hypothetical protein [Amycolatopsis sp.]
MTTKTLLRQLPLRVTAGAFLLNSGFGKVGADKDAAEQMHGFAAGTYPALGKLDPSLFAKALAAGEIATGMALLIPFVPAAIAGIGLTAFSAGLLGLYLKTPGMRKEGSVRPTEQGLTLAKDVWLFGIGLALVLDGSTGTEGRS